MKRLLIVVDYQNDFVSGSLGFEKAIELEDYIFNLIQQYKDNNDEIIYTMDTHDTDYLDTYEGKNLPVPHCIKNSEGWKLYGKIEKALEGCQCFYKDTFPSLELANFLKDKNYSRIALVGVVSHICVLSNAIMVKSALPNTPIDIDMNATASHDESTHQKCIDVLKSMHFNIIE